MPAPFTYLDLVHTKIFLPPSLLVLASLRLPTKDVIFFILPCMYFKYSLCVRAHFVCILSHSCGRCLPACIHVCAHVVCVLVVCVHVCKHACICYSTCILAHDCVSSLSTLCAWLCVCVLYALNFENMCLWPVWVRCFKYPFLFIRITVSLTFF